MPKIIEEVINKKGLLIDDYELYGNEIAKVKSIKKTNKNDPKLIVITAMNPNPAGEGKTTTTIGLVDALNKHGYKAIGALREPSMGPVFGMKGTGSGGGLSFLKPFDKINLHFSGDFHAITAANNLIVAVIENEIHNKSSMQIDPQKILIKRCLDVNDRSLRNIEYNLNHYQTRTGFNITAASDLMALFCLAKDHKDFENKLAETIIAYNIVNQPIRICDLELTKAIMTILDDALYANLVRTNEDNPVFVHGGPFANIAHGCNSIIATKNALALSDYVVTECGFGSDLGLEKFMNIKMASLDLKPDLIGLVISLKSIAYHAQTNEKDYIKQGFANVLCHINHIKKYNVPFIVYINVNTNTDSEEDLLALEKLLDENQIEHARSYAYSYGSKKSEEITKKTVALTNQVNDHQLKLIYDIKDHLSYKLKKICENVYGADGYELSYEAKEQLNRYEHLDFYLCIAKTPYSISDDAKLLNNPKNFKIHIERFEINYAAKLIIAITTTIYRMPGLNKEPAAKNFVMK